MSMFGYTERVISQAYGFAGLVFLVGIFALVQGIKRNIPSEIGMGVLFCVGGSVFVYLISH